jgi:para-aminobenzoate synthetase component 1
LLLDGTGSEGPAWDIGPLVAVDPVCVAYTDAESNDGLAALERLVSERRAKGGTAETGVAALLAYELFDDPRPTRDTPARLVVLTVDRSVRIRDRSEVLLSSRDPTQIDSLRRRLEELGEETPDTPATAVRCVGQPRTSLPRTAYLNAVERVRHHIADGDIYQANLCQRFSVECEGDPFSAYAKMTGATPAPRSAFVETPWFALVSISPETFLRVDRAGVVESWPIKGTRPRGATQAEDQAAAASLMGSEKDQAELLMIVDLERNDLSRICRPGSVEVPELVALRSYPTVHHLVSRVRGRLAAQVGVRDLLRATFPGGSITGAPKIRAMEILRELEPVPRGLFTGSLFWFGDDGTLDSSILIRSWVFAEGRGWLGAGGGIVADSEPDAEWQESNHKARALTEALGFDPEEAG